MAAPHPFRFGVQVSNAASAGEWISLARAVEAGGYDTLFIPDHLGDQLAPFPALMAAAMATERLIVAPLVLDNDFRHPAMLAKEAATLHLLAGGRTELGLGAGWMTTDYDRSGIVYDRPGVRIDRMVEAMAICRSFFAAEGPVKHEGEHYRITDLPAAPASPGGGPRRRAEAARRRWWAAGARHRGAGGRHRGRQPDPHRGPRRAGGDGRHDARGDRPQDRSRP